MMTDEKNNAPAPSGNASNPSLDDTNAGSAGPDQLLGKKAEKYLREAGNIEDMPDAQEDEQAAASAKQSGGDSTGTGG